jgi:GNAT superfamily N-acetyltransferase
MTASTRTGRDTAGNALRRAVIDITRRTPGASVHVDDSGVTTLINPAPVPTLTGLVLPDAPVDVGRLRALAAPFVAGGRPWSISVLGEARPEVAELSAELHLEPESEPTMVLSIDGPVQRADGPDAETYHRVATPDERREWSALADTAFGMPAGSSAALMSPGLVQAPGVLPVLARRDGVAVAVGISVQDGRWVGLFSVATAAEVRRSGVGERLIRFLLREAARAGARTAYLQTSEMARSLYTRIGFRDEPVDTTYFTARP